MGLSRVDTLLNPFEYLQVDESSSPEEIQAAWRRFATYYHPDRNPDPKASEYMVWINRSREILLDPELRAEWFRAQTGAQGGDGCASTPEPETEAQQPPQPQSGRQSWNWKDWRWWARGIAGVVFWIYDKWSVVVSVVVMHGWLKETRWGRGIVAALFTITLANAWSSPTDRTTLFIWLGIGLLGWVLKFRNFVGDILA